MPWGFNDSKAVWWGWIHHYFSNDGLLKRALRAYVNELHLPNASHYIIVDCRPFLVFLACVKSIISIPAVDVSDRGKERLGLCIQGVDGLRNEDVVTRLIHDFLHCSTIMKVSSQEIPWMTFDELRVIVWRFHVIFSEPRKHQLSGDVFMKTATGVTVCHASALLLMQLDICCSVVPGRANEPVFLRNCRWWSVVHVKAPDLVAETTINS